MGYNYYNYGGMDPNGLAAFGAAAFAVVILFAIIGLALAVLYIIGMYKLLKKGEKHPVGAFIAPIGTFQMMELTGMNPWWLLIVALCAIVGAIPLIGWLFMLAVVIYFMIIYCSGIAKSYGKDSTGFIVGLVLLHPIFIFILGIGDSKYVGPKPEKDIIFNKEGKVPTE